MQAKMRHQEWMSRKTRRRTENRGGQFVPMFDKGSHQGYPAKAIFAQGALRVIEITFQNESRAVVERMGQRCRRVNPFEAEFFKWQSQEEGGPGCEGMNCRAEIVLEAGKGQFQGAASAASNGLGLEDLDLEPGLREHDGGSETVGARSDNAGFRNARWHLARGVGQGRRC